MSAMKRLQQAAWVLGFAGAFSVTSAMAQSPRATPEQWNEIVAAANKERRVVIYSNAVPQVQERLKADFEKAHPEIKVEFMRYGSGQLVSKLDQERKAGVDGADVTVSTEAGWLDERIKEQSLKAPAGPSVAAWPVAQLMGGIVPVLAVEPVAIVYNTNLVKTPVNGYPDLLKPEFRGKLGIEDLASTSVIAFYEWLERTQGADYHNKTAQQQVKIYPSTVTAVQMVASGEIAIANFMNPTIAVPLIKDGAPLKLVVPEPAWSSIRLGAVLGWSKRPNAAQVMMDYLMSPRGQTVWNGHGDSASVLPKIPGSLTIKSIAVFDHNKWPQGTANAYRAKWMSIFRK